MALQERQDRMALLQQREQWAAQHRQKTEELEKELQDKGGYGSCCDEILQIKLNGSNLIMSNHTFCMPAPYTALVCRISGQ